MQQTSRPPQRIIDTARICALAILISLSGFSSAAVSELPTLGEDSTINIERETRLGRSVYDRLMESGLIETQPLLDRYINDLGFLLLAGVENRVRDYRFFIVRDDSVNAFALPGGYIGVNRGLIRQARTQHQLASVLAHEIAHVRLMHGLDLMNKSKESSNSTILALLAGLLLGGVDSQLGAAVLYGGIAGSQQALVNFTRENEYEADRLGFQLLDNAQFDPNGMVEFFSIMSQLSGSSELGSIEYLRTHPVGENRVAEAIGRIARSSTGRDQVGDYLQFKDYLLYTSTDHLPQKGSEFQRALALVQAGDFNTANRALNQLYKKDPDNMWYSIAFAENLERLGREDEAELVYRRLLDIFPGDYVLSMNLLRLLKLSGRYQSALIIARRIETRHPEDRQVYFELSGLYDSLNRPALRMMAEAEYHRITGNSRQAVKLYDQVLEMPDTDLATASRAREKRLLLLER